MLLVLPLLATNVDDEDVVAAPVIPNVKPALFEEAEDEGVLVDCPPPVAVLPPSLRASRGVVLPDLPPSAVSSTTKPGSPHRGLVLQMQLLFEN